MQEVEVSIIVPTVGRQNRIERALDSVVRQNYENCEVIVVDGSGSEAIESLTETIPVPSRYFYQQGSGPSNGRNIGIEHAKGEYLAFLDDDDWWKPGKLQAQVEKLDQSSDELSFIFTGVKSVTSDGTIINVRKPQKPPTFSDILTRNSIGTPSSVMAKASTVRKVNGFAEYPSSREDWDLYIRLLSEFRADVIPEAFVIKEVHENTRSKDIMMIERDWMVLFEKYKSMYTPRLEKRFKSNYHFVLGRKHAETGEIKEARYHFLKSLSMDFTLRRMPYLMASLSGARGYQILQKTNWKLRNLSFRSDG